MEKFNLQYPEPPLVSSMKVLYLGGINSTGQKGRDIAHDGYVVEVPKMPSNNNVQVGIARFLPNCLKGTTGVGNYLEELKASVLSQVKEQPDLIVGSSQGGALAMALQKEFPDARLLLIAPAWNTFGVEPKVPSNTVILHGTNDWLVPLYDSKHLANLNKCTVVQVNDSHHLGKSHDAIINEIDKISVDLGKHKSDEVIKKEYEEWKAQRDAYFAELDKFHKENAANWTVPSSPFWWQFNMYSEDDDEMIYLGD